MVLLGMGFDALSVGHAVLPRVKAAIRRVNSASLREFADEALRCQSRTDVERLLRRVHASTAEEASREQWGNASKGNPPNWKKAQVMA